MVSEVRAYFANNPELFLLIIVLDVIVLYILYRLIKFSVKKFFGVLKSGKGKEV